MICNRWFLNDCQQNYFKKPSKSLFSKLSNNHCQQLYPILFSKTLKQSHSMLFFARIFRSFRSTSKKFLLKHYFQTLFSTIIFKTTCFEHHFQATSSNNLHSNLLKSLSNYLFKQPLQNHLSSQSMKSSGDSKTFTLQKLFRLFCETIDYFIFRESFWQASFRNNWENPPEMNGCKKRTYEKNRFKKGQIWSWSQNAQKRTRDAILEIIVQKFFERVRSSDRPPSSRSQIWSDFELNFSNNSQMKSMWYFIKST